MTKAFFNETATSYKRLSCSNKNKSTNEALQLTENPLYPTLQIAVAAAHCSVALGSWFQANFTCPARGMALFDDN